ncbi:MAG: AAA family ATPase [Paracoccaceae bacterium]
MFFNDPPSKDDKQQMMREVLALVPPDGRDIVYIVAQSLKTEADTYEPVFLEWSKPFGRLKARKIWSVAKPDPDVLQDLIEMRFEAAKRRERFKFRTAAELQALPSPPPRIKGVFPAEGLAVVFGASGSAKSFLCTTAAASIATGEHFFGHPTRNAPVLYIALEGEGGYRGRTLAWERYYQRSFPLDVRFSIEPFSLIDPQDVDDLASLCPPGVVIIIDTLNRAAPGADENSSKDMGAIIGGAKTLQRLTAGLVVLVAHTGKDATRGLRGHSSLFAALDAAILVERNGDARTWRVEKAKDGEDGETHGFRLKSIIVGTDDDGDDETSCVVVPDDSAAQRRNFKELTATQHLGMATFNEAAGAHGVLDDNSEFVGVHIEAWRPIFYRKSPSENDDTKRKSFNRARSELVRDGHLTVHNDYYRIGSVHGAVQNAAIAAMLIAKRDSGTIAGHSRDSPGAPSGTRRDTPL